MKINNKVQFFFSVFFWQPLKIFLVAVLVLGWVFSGWPRVWNNPPFPPEVQEVRAATIADSTPGTVASVADAGTGCTNADTNDWGTMTNTTTSNDAYAIYGTGNFFDASEVSEEFQLSNFGILIPDGSTINGITVAIERKGTSADIQDRNINLTKTAGVQLGTNKAVAADWGTTDATATYGSGSDVWGTTWSEAEIEASGFGLVICVQTLTGDANAVASIDLITVTITYTAVAPTVTTQAAGSVEATTATGNGTIEATGGENASAWGVCYKTSSPCTTADSVAAGSGTGGAGTFTASITSLLTGTTYYIKAYATNSAGTSYGSEVQILTKPAAPTSLNFTSVTATTLRLNWTAPTGAASYKVERCTGTGCSSWAEIATGVTNIYYDDSGRTGNTVYRYQVRATNATGDGAYSSGVEQLMLPDVPGTPTFSGVTGTSITVNWNASTGGSNNNYYVERAPDVSGSPGSWAEVGTTVTSPWTNNTGLSCETTYWYKVRGNNTTGYGSYSGNASRATGLCNTAPSFSGNPTDSPDPVVTGYDVTFSGTANDTESNGWYLAICKTNSITPGSPPNCDTSQSLCVSSSAVGTGSQNTCTWTSSGTAAQDWYAFACDNNASPLCSSADTFNSPVTVNAVVVSVTLSEENFVYGTMSANAASSTLALFSGAGIVASNDGSVTEDFDIYSDNTTGWTLDSSNATLNHYIHQFCNDTDNVCTSPPTSYSAMSTSTATSVLKAGVASSGTVAFQLRITTPNTTNVYTQQSAAVTVQASAQ